MDEPTINGFTCRRWPRGLRRTDVGVSVMLGILAQLVGEKDLAVVQAYVTIVTGTISTIEYSLISIDEKKMCYIIKEKNFLPAYLSELAELGGSNGGCILAAMFRRLRWSRTVSDSSQSSPPTDNVHYVYTYTSRTVTYSLLRRTVVHTWTLRCSLDIRIYIRTQCTSLQLASRVFFLYHSDFRLESDQEPKYIHTPHTRDVKNTYSWSWLYILEFGRDNQSEDRFKRIHAFNWLS